MVLSSYHCCRWNGQQFCTIDPLQLNQWFYGLPSTSMEWSMSFGKIARFHKIFFNSSDSWLHLRGDFSSDLTSIYSDQMNQKMRWVFGRFCWVEYFPTENTQFWAWGHLGGEFLSNSASIYSDVRRRDGTGEERGPAVRVTMGQTGWNITHPTLVINFFSSSSLLHHHIHPIHDIHHISLINLCGNGVYSFPSGGFLYVYCIVHFLFLFPSFKIFLMHICIPMPII